MCCVLYGKGQLCLHDNKINPSGNDRVKMPYIKTIVTAKTSHHTTVLLLNPFNKRLSLSTYFYFHCFILFIQFYNNQWHSALTWKKWAFLVKMWEVFFVFKWKFSLVLNWMHDNLKWIISNNNVEFQFFLWIYFFFFSEKKLQPKNKQYLPNSSKYDA